VNDQAPPPEADPLIGTVLAERYKVMQRIGEGGMGSVYVGQHVTLGKQVALKVLKQEMSYDRTVVERFLREAKATSSIEHENVVQILDYGHTPSGSAFFAMEFLRGQELTELIAELGRISWYRAKPILLQICHALAAAHDAGIIHRDIKPGNVLLIKRGGRSDFVKILDFGIAKVEDEVALTRAGMVFGTAAYMAPEQATASKLDGRADMYALACVAFEMLTGRLPFDAKHPIKMLNCHIREPAPSMRMIAPAANVPAALDEVILRALAKLPDERYSDMYAFAEALDAIPRGEPPAEPVNPVNPIATTQSPSADAMQALQQAEARQQQTPRQKQDAAERESERTEPHQVVFPQGGGPPRAAPVPIKRPGPPRPTPRRAPMSATMAMTSPPPVIPGAPKPFPPELPPIAWLFVGLVESAEGHLTNDDLLAVARRLNRWAPELALEQVATLVRHTLADWRALPDVATRGARTRELNRELAELLPRMRLAEVLAAMYEIASDDGNIRDQELRFIVNTTAQLGLSPDPRMLAIAFLYLTLSYADGTLDEAEKLVLRESASQWTPEATIAERAVVIRWAVAEFKRRPSYEEKLVCAREAADQLAMSLDADTLRRIVADLWRLAGADGHIAPEEQAFIGEIVRRFGLN
jgi:serine/threonine protein kinase/uncharacterized tellurite resistance protein B-like protein